MFFPRTHVRQSRTVGSSAAYKFANMKFHDFRPGIQIIKFHDFPDFLGPVRTQLYGVLQTTTLCWNYTYVWGISGLYPPPIIPG